ncbi:MAG: response regulator [Nitrosopumilales archaeon CG_4_9_14_0_2_um_filter_34_16]|nr:MAG: response regulator [Nitrosopumilales archaeon CG_4_9_14_0_2_um_filter_34_16]
MKDNTTPRKLNCIIIDDDQNIVDVFCDLLGIIDVNVLATGNDGKNAVNLYEKHNPDIVFTDLQMPEYNGYYVVETIKDLDPDAKLVVVTGDPDAVYSNLFDLLHVPVVNKPFDIAQIKKIITDITSENNSILPFEIRYKFKDDINYYSCTVTYPQYRNFKRLPIIEECEIITTQKTLQPHEDEMQRALDLVMQNDTSHIRKLSELVRS